MKCRQTPNCSTLATCFLLPGLVDTHVHINEPGRTEWEGFETATQAAAAGGVTTLVDMPLNCVPETIDVPALEAKRSAAQGKAWVDWAAWGGVVRGNADALQSLARAGVPGFKCFLIHSGIDGFAWVDEADLRAALEKLRGTGLPLLAHAEVAGPVDAATQRAECERARDWRKYSTYLASRPDAAEIEAIAMLIRLAEDFRRPSTSCILSSAQALPLLARRARARRAHHRGNLRALSLVCRRRDSRRRDGIQMRAADSRRGESRGAVERARTRV